MRNVVLYTFTFCALLMLQGCSKKLFKARPPVTLSQAWASDNTLRTPESALFDEARNLLYVSNINQMSGSNRDGDGFISILTPEGEIERLHWVTGLNDPKGMALANNVLYVADVDEVIAISTQSGGILGRYKAENAKFLNDVTADEDGNVYISDSETKVIYHLKNGRLSPWIENTQNEKPNGLLLENENRMVVALMSSGKINLLDPQTKKFTEWAEGIPSADGIVQLENSDYLISNWNGEVYYVNQKGETWKVLDTKAEKVNAADIEFSGQTRQLYVPTFKDNRVVAYNVLF